MISNLQNLHHNFGNPCYNPQLALGPKKDKQKGSPNGVRKLASFLAKPFAIPTHFILMSRIRTSGKILNIIVHIGSIRIYIFQS